MDDTPLHFERDRLDALVSLTESAGWRVLCEDLRAHFARLDRALHNTADTQNFGDVRYLQGQLFEIKRLLDQPNQMVKEARAKLGLPAASG